MYVFLRKLVISTYLQLSLQNCRFEEMYWYPRTFNALCSLPTNFVPVLYNFHITFSQICIQTPNITLLCVQSMATHWPNMTLLCVRIIRLHIDLTYLCVCKMWICRPNMTSFFCGKCGCSDLTWYHGCSWYRFVWKMWMFRFNMISWMFRHNMI